MEETADELMEELEQRPSTSDDAVSGMRNIRPFDVVRLASGMPEHELGRTIFIGAVDPAQVQHHSHDGSGEASET